MFWFFFYRRVFSTHTHTRACVLFSCAYTQHLRGYRIVSGTLFYTHYACARVVVYRYIIVRKRAGNDRGRRLVLATAIKSQIGLVHQALGGRGYNSLASDRPLIIIMCVFNTRPNRSPRSRFGTAISMLYVLPPSNSVSSKLDQTRPIWPLETFKCSTPTYTYIFYTSITRLCRASCMYGHRKTRVVSTVYSNFLHDTAVCYTRRRPYVSIITRNQTRSGFRRVPRKITILRWLLECGVSFIDTS